MSGTTRRDSDGKSGRTLDFFVILLCLLGFVISLFMFQADLFKTFRSMAIQPAGTVTVKYNTVQRRLSDRVVWDRLYSESPVYPGDVIRIAKLSGAILNIENNNVELGENTLIRIQKDGGPSQIDFYQGEISIASEKDSGDIVLVIADRQIHAAGGTVLSAAIGDEGMILRVNEGTVQVIQDGQVQSAAAGTVIVQDSNGRERLEPMAVVTQPRPNARYLKTVPQPVNVNFAWSRINLEGGDTLRLEIAEDRNFAGIAQTFENSGSTAAVSLGAGLWYWRLSFHDTVLSSGRVTVTEAGEPVLINPAMESQIYFKTARPQINFRWSEVDEALYYILQVCESPDFTSPRILEQVRGTFFISPELDFGKWFWRVQAVYPPVYEGSAAFSSASVFYVNQRGELEPPVLNSPAPDSMVNIGADRTDLSFSWAISREAVSYNIRISSSPNLSNPAVDETVRNNFYIYGKDENALTPGQYYWSVSCTDGDGNMSPLPQSRPFMAIEREVSQRLIFPPDSYSVEDGQLRDVRFTWRTNLPFDRRFQVSALPDFSTLEIDEPVTGDSFQGVSVPPGDWYWRISARHDDQSSVYSTPARRFSLILPQPPAPEPPPEPARLVALVSPMPGEVIPGLTALIQPTLFRWDTSENVVRSRFVLSRNSNPARQPEVEILNPGRTIAVNDLGEGLWYWTIEAQTRDGQSITPNAPRQFRVQAIPPLPAPGNMRPVNGHIIGAGELRQSRNIVFNWSAVSGANAYILTISRQTPSGRRQIFQTEPRRALSYTFDKLELLDHSSTYIWQVEALLFNSSGAIERHGLQGENSLILDVPLPGRVQTEDTGVLYGF